MKNNVKNIYASVVSLTDHIQMVGYREIVESHARAWGLSGVVFNYNDGSVKLMASGSESAVTGFIEELKVQREGIMIDTVEIVEDIILPSPFGRITVDEMREISERFDKGIMILGEMNGKLGGIDTKLDGVNDKLGGIDTKLDKLDEISDKLDSLPDKIAEAIQKSMVR